MEYIFLGQCSFIFECPEKGHFMDTLLFLLRLLKSFTFIVHKPVIYSLFIYIHISKLWYNKLKWRKKMNIGYARVSTGLQIALKQKSI